jgi:hypothetical protein
MPNGTPSDRPLRADTLGEAVRQFSQTSSGRILGTQTAVLAVLRARRGRPEPADAALAAAVVVWWPLQEWLAHRFILHAEPKEVAGRTIDPKVAQLHRAHHADPWRNVGLPLPFLTLAVPVHAAAWLLLTRNRERALTGMLAYSSATLVYEWTHFLTHTAYRPRGSWFRRLQRRHRLHHFKHEKHWYGFTVPYVDDLFGTAPDPSTIDTSPTVRTLGVAQPA